MSVAMRISTSGVDKKISKAITMKVYGRRRASLTIHIFFYLSFLFARGARSAGSEAEIYRTDKVALLTGN
jgi:hypothetical protein